MLFKSLFISQLATAGLVYRIPNPSTNPPPRPISEPAPEAFSVLTLRSASAIHFNEFNAADSGIFLQLADSKATCDGGETPNAATFYLKDGELFLYSTKEPAQKVFSTTGGKLGYVTGDQAPPSDAKVIGWSIDSDGNLNSDGAGFIACPGSESDDPWTVWVNVPIPRPIGNENCLGFTTRTNTVEDPVSCQYTK
ncbi:hypothetical protein BGZ63DRAFT_425601 [Mariannaea sp. PMI_226]|nr:hypothetical protein BGZ63DRAFT_425601 [Mariannaea sp. PMI_226]